MPDPIAIPMTRQERARNTALRERLIKMRVAPPLDSGLSTPCWLGEHQKSNTHPAHMWAIGGKLKWAYDHRVSKALELWDEGYDLEGEYVLHRCDRPTCMNPEHLRLGTVEDNVQDREKRRREQMPDGNGRLGPFGELRLKQDYMSGLYTQTQLRFISGLPTREQLRTYLRKWERER